MFQKILSVRSNVDFQLYFWTIQDPAHNNIHAITVVSCVTRYKFIFVLCACISVTKITIIYLTERHGFERSNLSTGFLAVDGLAVTGCPKHSEPYFQKFGINRGLQTFSVGQWSLSYLAS